MASFNKVNDFVENLAEKLIDLSGSALTIALSNTAPGAESPDPSGDGNGVLANVTQINYTNLSTRVLTVDDSAQSGGTYKLKLVDLILTASGGTVGPFRYIYIYDDDSTGDKLIAYYDFGSALTLQDGETFTINFDGSAGVLTIA